MLASEKDYVATRIANRLNLHGPAVSIHTACSTSLVAVAQAWHALASGQCDIALAGGASIVVPQNGGYLHVEGGMESADGHCRPFDERPAARCSPAAVAWSCSSAWKTRFGRTATPSMRSSAASGINNDGGDKASFTAPSMSGQADAIRMALDHAGVSARSIGYVEAHGTGTSLGDPIEVAALATAWQSDVSEPQFCGIGSVKGNLGHLTAAAGVVGLIKAALVLVARGHSGHPALPPRQPANRLRQHAVQGGRSRHTLAAHCRRARRAAVSSFGVGGTNAHVVLEEAPPQPPRPLDRHRLLILPLSAGSPSAALQRARDLADLPRASSGCAAGGCRRHADAGSPLLPNRIATVARSASEAVRRASEGDAGVLGIGTAAPGVPLSWTGLAAPGHGSPPLPRRRRPSEKHSIAHWPLPGLRAAANLAPLDRRDGTFRPGSCRAAWRRPGTRSRLSLRCRTRSPAGLKASACIPMR